MTKTTEKTTDVRRVTTEEWFNEAKALFGDDPKKWRFVCPNCKNVQTIQDFIDLREHGIEIKDAQVAYYNCIGRYDTRIPPAKIGRLEKDPLSPCDFTMSGLFPICKTMVIDEKGRETRVFEFAKEAPAEKGRKGSKDKA